MSKQIEIGMPMRGFRFDTDGWTESMAPCIGQVGTISEIQDRFVRVDFGVGKWWYPLSMVAEHLVGEEKDEAFKVGGTRLPETEAEVEHFDRTGELPVVTKEWLDKLGKEGDDFISQLHDSVSFDEFVEDGRKVANIVNGMPWHWKWNGYAVSHENDQLYLITTPTGTLRFTPDYRLAFVNRKPVLNPIKSAHSEHLVLDEGGEATMQAPEEWLKENAYPFAYNRGVWTNDILHNMKRYAEYTGEKHRLECERLRQALQDIDDQYLIVIPGRSFLDRLEAIQKIAKAALSPKNTNNT